MANRAGFTQAPVLPLPFIKLYLVFWAQPMASFQLLKLALLPPAKEPLHVRSPVMKKFFFTARLPPLLVGQLAFPHLQS